MEQARKRGRELPDAEVREAFSSLASELPLELVGSEVEARCVGIAFAGYSRTVDVDLDKEGGGDDAAPGATPAMFTGAAPAAAPTAAAPADVAQLLSSWESLAPDQFAANWRNYATDPYVGVGPGWVGTVDQSTFETWLASPELKEALESHPPYSPRHVQLSNLQVVTLGPGRVLAVYRVEETYQNGTMSAGNTFAVLMRVRGKGWRIACASKGTRHEAALREE
jgi:hypothetical protein